MALLKKLYTKKVKASSLTEVLVATVIIVLVLGIALTTLNNVLQSSVTNQTNQIQTELSEIQYLYKNGKIKLPFNDEVDNWNITVFKEKNTGIVSFEAEHQSSKKRVVKKLIVNEDF